MFAKSVVDSDVFLDMPLTARLLYYDLGMRADDDGFVGSPKKIMRMVGASQDDLRILIARRFVIPFDSGVVVIRHWKQNNYLRPDRHTPTVYAEEFAMLSESKTGTYEPMAGLGIPNANQLVDERYTQESIGKVSIDNINNISASGETNKAKKAEYETEFEEIWKRYPKKHGKPNALRDYIKARKNGVERKTIEDGLTAYIEYCKRTNRFFKDGSTWFHQQAWDDDYEDDLTQTEKSGFDIEEHVKRMREEGLL